MLVCGLEFDTENIKVCWNEIRAMALMPVRPCLETSQSPEWQGWRGSWLDEMHASFHLLIRGDYAENYFSKLAVSEFSEWYSLNNLQRQFDDGDRQMSTVIDKTRDIILEHFQELFLKQALEACKDNPTLSSAIIVDDLEFKLIISFFYNCRLWNS